MPQLDFEVWGAVPFHKNLEGDTIAQAVLVAIRTDRKDAATIAHECAIDINVVEKTLTKLYGFDLVTRTPVDGG